jgi:16S rRNA (guanine527-N7)-methyltransferase
VIDGAKRRDEDRGGVRFHVKHRQVGHDEAANLEFLLQRLAHRAGLRVSDAEARLLVGYLIAVLAMNEEINLTRITGLREGVRLHIIDSIVALPEIRALPIGPILDLGSGGGFPGVPLSIVLGRQVVLLDAARKKGAAVARILSRGEFSEIKSCVVSERAEEHAVRNRNCYAAVVARAVTALPSLIELASPLLMEGGALVALKGCPDSTERESGAATARLVGMRPSKERRLVLPGGPAEARTILTYTKVAPSSVHLPRRAGLAQRRPLA